MKERLWEGVIECERVRGTEELQRERQREREREREKREREGAGRRGGGREG